ASAGRATGTAQTPGRGDPAGVPAERQIIRLNLGAEPGTIDPQKVAYVGEIAIVMRLFSNLLAFDGKGHLVPEMAERLPAISADGKTLTFTLRRGLLYSDGHPLQAKDFEYGWKRHLDPRTAGEYAFTGYAIEGAEEFHSAGAADQATLNQVRDAVGVQAAGDRLLIFTLKHPAPWFLSVLATWCGVPTRQDLVEQGGDTWTEPPTYVGNGPYILKTWEHDSRLVLEANPNYYRGAPSLTTIDLAMIGEPAAAFAAYGNGELDLVSVESEDLPVVEGDAELRRQYQRFPGRCTTYLGFNTTLAPFDHPAVRRAFAAALDRDEFVSQVLGAIGVPAEQLVPPGLPGSYRDLQGQRFDPAQARRLLAGAGFPGGEGLPAITFTYAATPANEARVAALSEQLQRNLGVSVEAEPVEARAYTARLQSQETTPQVFLAGWCQEYPDPQNWYSTVFHSGSMASGGIAGHTGWANAEFDRLAEQADAEQDQIRRQALYQRAAQLLIDEAPVAFLYHTAVSRLVKPYVAGLPQNPLDYYPGQSNLSGLTILKH
ncbi:MAG: peptide ABC transporter substrate-binding protein, partial [Chloroflexota bacterium]